MYQESRLSHNWLIHRIGNRLVWRCLSDLNGTVLDVGCGERPFEKEILQHVKAYIGIDWSNTMHRLKADVVADVNLSLPFCSSVFDHVLSFEVLEHLSEPDVMLSEAFRVLKSGGGLTLSMPFQWWLHEAPWDYQRFTRYGLDYHLRKAGFEQIGITPHTGFWVMWTLKFNYQTARLIRGPKLLRWLVRALFVPMWYLNQTVAPWLDKFWPAENETCGYFVTAIKK